MNIAVSPAELTGSQDTSRKKALGMSSLFIPPLIVLFLAELFTLPFIVGDRGFIPNLTCLFTIAVLGLANGAPLLLYIATVRDRGRTARAFDPSRRKLLMVGLLFAGVVIIEVICANLSYYGLGWLGRIVMMLAVGQNFFVPVFYWRGLRNAALVVAVVIAILVIPYNLLLGQRLLALQDEANHVVAYINQVKEETGVYPSNLYEYRYKNWYLWGFFRIYTPQQYPTMEQPFGVGYCPTAREECSYGYWYTPTYGWNYSDD
jgi:hypothetical protein